MSRVTQVAVAGVVLFGALGCSASAQTDSPTPGITLTPGLPSPTVTIPRQDIDVVVEPSSVTGGATRSVRITAQCPLPQGGTAYRAVARSDAFTGPVSLLPPVASPSASPTAEPAVPGLTGSAPVRADAKAGGYKVQVRCEATNDIGSASFKVVSPTPAHTRIPTRAPHAGGGGTAAGGPADDSGLPVGVTAVALLAVLGIGIGVARRRSRS
ncbi:hypothetical protein GCM10023194_11210 [Planotetraspora phitsanulokensis]|uniref:Gram-positive cocci surface proteins LPxTG domain-containing protein n=1 Tax=Planotetraspora phitsanulokensis TaxID=575192 RepID=A0A8J3U948_9ACTN|nr:hypothetical protein [Planotetraspora phitsanulokensis]GII40555.1 hypothetical protein Pph01_55580 [Planotetraspora phitsanulokensis]